VHNPLDPIVDDLRLGRTSRDKPSLMRLRFECCALAQILILANFTAREPLIQDFSRIADCIFVPTLRPVFASRPNDEENKYQRNHDNRTGKDTAPTMKQVVAVYDGSPREFASVSP